MESTLVILVYRQLYFVLSLPLPPPTTTTTTPVCPFTVGVQWQHDMTKLWTHLHVLTEPLLFLGPNPITLSIFFGYSYCVLTNFAVCASYFSFANLKE